MFLCKNLTVLNKVEMNLLFKGLINNMKMLNNIVIMAFYSYYIGEGFRNEKYNL